MGAPSDWMADRKFYLKAWEAFKNEFPWLKESDRGVIELATSLRAAFWENPAEFGVNRMNQLRLIYSSLGGTPADLTKVYSPEQDGEDEDPINHFLN